MRNFDSTISAITEELSIQKDWVAFYAQRVAKLEEMIRSIDALGHVASIEKIEGYRRGGKWARKNDLPSTSGTFWQDQVTSIPKTWIEILDGAIANLGISLNSDQRRRFRQRMIFTITDLVAEGKVKNLGTGRERRFFK